MEEDIKYQFFSGYRAGHFYMHCLIDFPTATSGACCEASAGGTLRAGATGGSTKEKKKKKTQTTSFSFCFMYFEVLLLEALPSAWEMDSSKATIWFTVLNTLLSGTQTYGLAWVSSYLFWEWESTFIVTISCAGSGSLEKPPIGSHKVACSRMFLEPISLVRSLNGLATPWPLGPSQDLHLHSSHFVSLGSELFTTIGSTSRCLRTTPSLGKLSFHSSFKETKWKRDQAVQQSCRKPSSC
ncbi:3-oxo-5-alpha-steroid 4-dehydrogenase 2 isoform X4 [Camelus bactrianus]|uniref:3-oxo-5-alpha-steroid 4-dehydrogenase 2 isoform X4 n=1 Tax=Camelus bactrianus TaxID=9837 RepID=A0AC58RJS0_CAMBA